MPTVYPTGTVIYDPNKAFEGYTIYTDFDLFNPEKNNIWLNEVSKW